MICLSLCKIQINAELIKALFLNIKNFQKECSKNEISVRQIEDIKGVGRDRRRIARRRVF